MSDKDKYLTTAAAAEKLGISPRRIRAMYHTGILAGIQPSEKVILIYRTAVENYVRQPPGRRWPPKNRRKKS